MILSLNDDDIDDDDNDDDDNDDVDNDNGDNDDDYDDNDIFHTQRVALLCECDCAFWGHEATWILSRTLNIYISSPPSEPFHVV